MMPSFLVGSSYPYLSRAKSVPRHDANLVAGGNARFKRVADSDKMHHDYAAELLLQMRRIATNEVLQSTPQSINTPSEPSVHLISPIHRPKETSIKILPVGSACPALPNCTVPSDSPSVRVSTLLSKTVPSSSSLLLSSLNASSRFRTVSIGGMNDWEGTSNSDWMRGLRPQNIVSALPKGSVSPLHLGLSHATSLALTDAPISASGGFVATPDTSKKLVFDHHDTYTKGRRRDRYHDELIQPSSNESFDQEQEGDDDTDDETTMDYCDHDTPKSGKHGPVRSSRGGLDNLNKKKNLIVNPSVRFTHKYVGETVAPDVIVRDVLRKKFSWKSFPELETYLINHRKQYLECSNAMNYTKAQKNYNNELTQGLLRLAANEGYVFEEFTFAAVRDRIRCFYKSFVQATKKKKRAHHHHKQPQH